MKSINDFKKQQLAKKQLAKLVGGDGLPSVGAVNTSNTTHDLGAGAYSTGNNVVFSNSGAGNQAPAHELSHVVQIKTK